MTKNKTPPIDPTVKDIIKEISSMYVRADMAGRRGNHDAELEYLLHALRSCYVLIGLHHSGVCEIENELVLSYAKSGLNTAKRIVEIVREVKDD